MRVIHVAPTPFGSSGLLGGGERYPLELARALAAHADCELITFGPHPGISRDPSGLAIRTLHAIHYAGGHPAHPLAPALPFALQADVIHTHHLRSLPSKVAALAGSIARKQLVVTDHGVAGSDWGGMLPRLFDRFLAVSAYSARQLQAPPARTRVIYGGANPKRFFPISGERSGVLFVGRLTPHKGADRLIEALPSDVHLTIAGSEGHDPQLPESGYPSLLRGLAAGRDVHFAGPVADYSLPALYRGARVFVLPSVHRTVYGREVAISELLGLVVLEAMMSGTPVIASALGGIPEIVQHGVTGFLVEPGNVAELRERLAELLGNPHLATRMGRCAREVAVDRFTWEACALRCLEAYSELAPIGAS